MRILILSLVLLVNTLVYSQQYISGNYYMTTSSCSSGSGSGIVCPSTTNQAGFIAKEGKCVYMKGISKQPISLNVSKDGSSIIESTYDASDYYCQYSIFDDYKTINECYEECTTSGINYFYQLSNVNDFDVPINTLLTINSNSEDCSNDWKNTWNFIEYYRLNTCTVDATGYNSYMLDCTTDGALTIKTFTGPICDTTPSISYLPISTDDCTRYQVCNK